jgi:RNA polymerase II subunit A small phosphatase-like protein
VVGGTEKSKKRFDKLLVLDLDETIIYGTEEPLDRPADFLAGKFHVYRRPGLDEFLTKCIEWFHVGVWTSSSSGYAEAVIPQLFPRPNALEFVWTSERCVRRFDPEYQNYYWIKDLKKLKKRSPLEKILMIDDTPKKLLRNYGNHVLVREWTGDLADRELEALLRYLEELGPVENVRAIEKRGWRQSRR